jgi:hypothetical protein
LIKSIETPSSDIHLKAHPIRQSVHRSVPYDDLIEGPLSTKMLTVAVQVARRLHGEMDAGSLGAMCYHEGLGYKHIVQKHNPGRIPMS